MRDPRSRRKSDPLKPSAGLLVVIMVAIMARAPPCFWWQRRSQFAATPAGDACAHLGNTAPAQPHRHRGWPASAWDWRSPFVASIGIRRDGQPLPDRAGILQPGRRLGERPPVSGACFCLLMKPTQTGSTPDGLRARSVIAGGRGVGGEIGRRRGRWDLDAARPKCWRKAKTDKTGVAEMDQHNCVN